MDEFDFIATYLRPLSGPGAFDLTDDVAQIGDNLYVSTDSYVEGLHFPNGWPREKIGPRVFQAAISDIIAKGLIPTGYLLNLSLPAGETGQADLMTGFERAQRAAGLTLLGGDTTGSDSGISISLTFFGRLPDPGLQIPLRRNARIGDDIWVTGTIGEAYLGLFHMDGSGAQAWRSAYDNPQLRTAFSKELAMFAHASADVSDGLLADLGHIVKASQLQGCIQLGGIPVSKEAETWCRKQTDELSARLKLLSGGDDYEIVFTAARGHAERIRAHAEQTGTRVTRIGQCRAGQGVELLDQSGQSIDVDMTGFKHF